MPHKPGRILGRRGCILCSPSRSTPIVTNTSLCTRGLLDIASSFRPTAPQSNWRRPKLGQNPAEHALPCVPGNPNGGSFTSTLPSNRRSTRNVTCTTCPDTSSISCTLLLIMSELEKLSTGCSQSQKTRGKPVNNEGIRFSTAPEEKSFLAVQISHQPNACNHEILGQIRPHDSRHHSHAQG